MTSWRSAARCVAGLLAITSACSGAESARDSARPAAGDAYEVVDASGVPVRLDGPAQRVVSLVPAASEMLHAMGRADVLVGRTDYDTATWAAAIPSVGGGLEPSLEAVVALDPDVVIRFSGEQDTRTPSRLDELGIPHVAVRPDRVEDIYRTVEMVGRTVGESARADSLVKAIRGGLDEAAATIRTLPRVRFAYVLDGTPPWVAGKDTFIDDVLSLMGGDNVFADLDALYAPVSPEQFRLRPIDVVLLAGVQPFDSSLTPGARLERLGGTLDLPGPSVVVAARRVGELLHGRRLP